MLVWRLSFSNDTRVWIRAASEKAARRRYLELRDKWVRDTQVILTQEERKHIHERPRITRVSSVKRPERFCFKTIYG